jgi:hypothetical protein
MSTKAAVGIRRFRGLIDRHNPARQLDAAASLRACDVSPWP